MRTTPSRRVRWGVPVAAVVTVAAAVTVPAALANGETTANLQPRSAQQLLTDLAGSRTAALSGTVVQTARLGLPKLPAGTVGTGPLSLTSGTNTLRVWADGPDRVRLALFGQLAEYDLVRDGANVWTYASQPNEAVHYTVPSQGSGSADAGSAKPTPAELPSTPQQAADTVLAAITPTTKVATGDSVKIAGRRAYQLVLTPNDTSSLVGSVRVAIDSKTAVPLRVQTYAKADPGVPAIEVGFTDVSFSAPDSSAFRFTAPKGAKVTEKAAGVAPTTPNAAPATPDAGRDQSPATAQPNRPEVRGQGWTSVLVMTGVDPAAMTGTNAGLLDRLTTRVPEGRLLKTSLVSVLLTNDGRLLAGAVTPDVLLATK